jgi:VIT1/CCC1 family predicted Fe2+/Mn2+ transporter
MFASNVRRVAKIPLRSFTFGGSSAIVTSLGLIVGFGAAKASTATVVGALLIVALADNLTDSLSIHIYQESEQLEPRAAFRATLTNFVTRLFVSLSFVLLVLTLPLGWALVAALAWGLLLLGVVTWLVARRRGANVRHELWGHLAATVTVLAVSRAVGVLILSRTQ